MKKESKIEKNMPTTFASEFEKVSGLREWIIWVIVLFVSFGFVFVGFFIDGAIIGDITFLDLSIYSVIIILAITAIYMSYRDAVFIDSQSKTASKQAGILVELNDISEFLESTEHSIFRTHIESLYRIFQTHSEISQENLIEILHSRLLSRNKVVELFASILITLGLIGTIIGLILMTNDLGNVLQNVGQMESQDLMQNIAGKDGPLGSLGVAFYTTLLGAVLGGVILRVLSNVVDANIMRYTAHIAELTEVNVLPFLRRMAKNLENAGYYQHLDQDEDD